MLDPKEFDALIEANIAAVDPDSVEINATARDLLETLTSEGERNATILYLIREIALCRSSINHYRDALLGRADR